MARAASARPVRYMRKPWPLIVAAVLSSMLWTVPSPVRAKTGGEKGGWLLAAAETASRHGKLERAELALRAYHQVVGKPAIRLRIARLLEQRKQWAAAAKAYKEYLAKKPADAEIKAALRRVEKREKAEPYSHEAMADSERATDLGVRAFRIGRRWALRHHYRKAAKMLQASAILDPKLPGPYRLLGAVYLRMGKSRRAHRHLANFLAMRPDGPLGRRIRRMLRGSGMLGTIRARASYRCDLWVNGRNVQRRTPASVKMPAGTHVVTFSCPEYHLISSHRVTVRAGKLSKVSFGFGVLKVQLQPWGRIRANGRDLGLWDKLGLPTGVYQLQVRSHDHKRSAEVEWRVKAGRVQKISWKALGRS